MLDLMYMYEDRIIQYPSNNPALNQVYSIEGMPDLIHQCYPDFLAFVDCNMESHGGGMPEIKIIVSSLSYPIDFINAAGTKEDSLWRVYLTAGKPIRNIKIKNDKEKTHIKNPITMRLDTPGLMDNVSSNVHMILNYSTSIGNNCHFKFLDARGIKNIGNDFSAESLVAPQLLKVGQGFKVDNLDAPMLPHPSNIARFDKKIQDQDNKISAAMAEIEHLQSSIKEMRVARDKLLAQRALCQSETR